MRYSFQSTSAMLAVAGLMLAGCQETSTYTKVEPAHVEHQEGEEISRLTLTEKAMERLDVQTVAVRKAESSDTADSPSRTIVPYSAIQYVAKGDAFVYTNPQPRTFIRQPVQVDHIEGDEAVLKDGPPPGSQVVSVGVAELFGTEFGVGH